MPEVVARGKLTDVVYAQLKPEEDLYLALLDIARQEGIETGLVLDITGALSRVRLSLPLKTGEAGQLPGVIELEGMFEASGHGIIGRTLDTYDGGASGIINRQGEPYIHVHLTVTQADKTYCGHLIDGCRVRSVHPKSHFTVVLARVEGVELNFRVSEERTPTYPRGIPYHELRARD